ncbi:MAG: sensor histidine kinase [Melioribacteraceae bacterium]
MINFNEQIFNSLRDPQNPLYISLLAVIALFGTIYFFYKYGIIPINERFKKEKESLELKSAKMMALFAQLDPDPVIRLNQFGEILETNEATKLVFANSEIVGRKISDLIPTLQLPENSIITNETKTITQKIGNKYFSILYRGESSLNLAQLYFRDITELKNYEERLLNYQIKLKSLSEHLHDLIEEERRRISSGLHDGIGQSLSLLRIKLLKLKETSNNQSEFGSFEEMVSNLEDTIRELKEITYSLKPRLLEEMGLISAIRNLVNKVGKEAGINGELNAVGDEIRFDEKLEITIFRIVQEAVNNIIKYSKATEYSIQLIYDEASFRLIVTDNGIGFDVISILRGQGSGMGLINMKERVESYNGKFKLDSFINNGTMLVAEIPIKFEKAWHSLNQYAS